MEILGKNDSYKTRELLKSSLQAQNMRFDVISNNIANADTPGFKRSSVTFEAQLRRALDSETNKGLVANVTDSRHIPFDTPIDWQSVTPKRVLDYATTMRNDGNNVDIDRESTDMAKTTMTYSALLDLLKQDYNLINLVLK